MVGVIALDNARATVREGTSAQLTAVADLKRQQLAEWFNRRVADVELLAVNFLNEEHFTVILAPDMPAERRDAFAGFLTDNLHSVQRANTGYAEIAFVDTSGRVVLSTEPRRAGVSHIGEMGFPAVTAALAAGSGTVTADAMQQPKDGWVEMWFVHALREVDFERNVATAQVNGAVVIRVILEESVFPLVA